MTLITGERISEQTAKAVPSGTDLFVIADPLAENYKITFTELQAALNSLTTNGDILYYNSGQVRLPIGSTDQVLTVSGGLPAWADLPDHLNDVFTTQGDIIYKGVINEERLGVGTNGQILTVSGNVPSWQDAGYYTSPLTTNGDLLMYQGTEVRLPAGTNGDFLVMSGGYPSWQPQSLYSDPLTTNGDILFYNSGTTRLPAGTNGQYLTMSSGLPAWTTLAGYSDPLTSNGDILVRSAGTTTRLGVGANDQVLEVVSGQPQWADIGITPLSDPTSSIGDIIYRGGGGLSALPVGTTGQFLVVDSGIPSWQTLNDLLSSAQIFNTVAVAGQSDIVADSGTDTLTFIAGSGISLTTNATTDELTITSTAADSYISNVALVGDALTFTGIGSGFNSTVDLSGYGPDYVSNVSYAGGNLTFTGTGGGFAGAVDISGVNTDDVSYVNDVSLIGTTLDFTGTGSATSQNVDLSSLVDYISNVSWDGSTLTFTGVGDAFNSTVFIGPSADSYVSNVTFSSITGDLTFTDAGSGSAFGGVVDLDGRWLQIPSMTTNQIPYWNGSEFVDSGLEWNNAQGYLGDTTTSGSNIYLYQSASPPTVNGSNNMNLLMGNSINLQTATQNIVVGSNNTLNSTPSTNIVVAGNSTLSSDYSAVLGSQFVTMQANHALAAGFSLAATIDSSYNNHIVANSLAIFTNLVGGDRSTDKIMVWNPTDKKVKATDIIDQFVSHNAKISGNSTGTGASKVWWVETNLNGLEVGSNEGILLKTSVPMYSGTGSGGWVYVRFYSSSTTFGSTDPAIAGTPLGVQVRYDFESASAYTYPFETSYLISSTSDRYFAARVYYGGYVGSAQGPDQSEMIIEAIRIRET